MMWDVIQRAAGRKASLAILRIARMLWIAAVIAIEINRVSRKIDQSIFDPYAGWRPYVRKPVRRSAPFGPHRESDRRDCASGVFEGYYCDESQRSKQRDTKGRQSHDCSYRLSDTELFRVP